MNTNRAQVIMLFKLWQQAKSVLMGNRETWTGAEEDNARHEFTKRTLGVAKSWRLKGEHAAELNNRGDIDLLKAGLLAIIQPGNLDAQLKQIRQPHKRAMYRLKELMGDLRVDWNYIAGIVHTMNAEGKLGSNNIDNLDAAELKKVIIALEQQNRRTKRIYHLHPA